MTATTWSSLLANRGASWRLLPGDREFAIELFQHADPTKRRLSPARLGLQLGKFYLWLYALFRQASLRNKPVETHSLSSERRAFSNTL
jgi:hypothetical protein